MFCSSFNESRNVYDLQFIYIVRPENVAKDDGDRNDNNKRRRKKMEWRRWRRRRRARRRLGRRNGGSRWGAEVTVVVANAVVVYIVSAYHRFVVLNDKFL